MGFPNTHTSISYKTSRPKVAPIWDTLVGHSCGTLLLLRTKRCEAARRAFRTRLPPKVTRQVSKTSVSYETSSKSHTSSLQNERFVRDFLQKSHVESPKRAFRTRLPPKVTLRGCKTSVSYETSSKSHARLQDERFVRDFLQKSRVKSQKRAFRTRLPPKVTRQVSKTSVSYETSSKSHTSSLQNERFVRDFLQKSRCEAEDERFVRDFLQKSRVESQKRAFRTRLPPKVTRQVSKTSVSYETSSKSPAETPIGAHTSRSPA